MWPPSLYGQGTENFFICSWTSEENHQHPLYGYAHVSSGPGRLGRTRCFGFFLESPISFKKSLLATIEHGHNQLFNP